MLCVFFIFLSAGCGGGSGYTGATTTAVTGTAPPGTSPVPSEEMRAVWLTHNEIYSMCKTGNGFRENISSAISAVADAGINTLIVQMRPFSDALYHSGIFPSSSYLGEAQGSDYDFDALEIIIKEAKSRGVSVHAWINPYRVSYSTDFSALADSNPAKLWHSRAEDASRLIVCEKGIWYKPSSPEVQRLIIDGACEIVRNYDIDAIHLDDYFYPVTDESIDAAEYGEYLSLGGILSLAQWRREQVSCMVSGLYAAIKRIKSGVLLGISPSGKIACNIDEMYADVGRWCSEDGYVDYIAPQLYYGFLNGTCPFEKTALEWQELVKNPDVSLIFGLAAYKCGKADEYAGTDEAKNEWINDSGVLLRQIEYIRTLEKHSGFALFSYSGIWNTNIADFSLK